MRVGAGPTTRRADLRGGVVWEISEQLDEETGEMRRAFQTVRPYRGQMRFESIAERDVGEIAPFNGSNVRNTIYALGAQLGRCRGCSPATGLAWSRPCTASRIPLPDNPQPGGIPRALSNQQACVMARATDIRKQPTSSGEFCMACGRPAPLPVNAAPLQLPARARQWRAEARGGS